MKVGLLSKHNAYDRNAFSGTVFYMHQALKQIADVRVLGGHQAIDGSVWGRTKRRLQSAPPFQLHPQEQADLDIIVAPVAVPELQKFHADVTVPVVVITDATPTFLEQFYGRAVTAQDHHNEAEVLRWVDGVIYSSHFMAETAQTEFEGLTSDKVYVVPFGVNLDTLPAVRPSKPPQGPLQLLFIGQDWERKGGSIALDTLEHLLGMGVSAHLTLIGPAPDAVRTHPHVSALGYLNKNKARDIALFSRSLEQAHVLVFPTRADCTPMVIAEANAYGCPVVGCQTGGLGTLVQDGINGHLLPWSAGGDAYARCIAQICATSDSYSQMSQTSFDYCHENLTWNAWSATMQTVLGDVLARTTHGA